MSLTCEPLLFEPFLRPMPWGGFDLPQRYGKSSKQPIGESWLLADHALHQSKVSGTGQSLKEVMGHPVSRFPLLIKVLDACENLSIQVHPDDDLAKKYANDEGGKTEAWLVLSATDEARIYLDLRDEVSLESFARVVKSGQSPDQLLKTYHPKPGEVYFVPAGTIHALGKGMVVLEVQQTSDATFRLYDWNRGRELHLDQGIPCCTKSPPSCGIQPLPLINVGSTSLLRCPYFEMKLWRGPVEATLDQESILVGIDRKYMLNEKEYPANHAMLLSEGKSNLLNLATDTNVVQIVNF